MENLFLFSPLFLIALGIVALVLPKGIAKYAPLLGAIAVAYFFYASLSQSTPSIFHYPWINDGAYALTLVLTPARLLFMAMLWFTLFSYGVATLSSDDRNDAQILFSSGGMALAIFAGDFITLFVGWEIMTWGSYLPLLHRGTEDKAPRRYMVFSLAGASSLLAGVLLLIQSSGSAQMMDFVFSPMSALAAPFLLVGFLLKAGIMPLHRWVPSTYRIAPDLFTGFMSAALSKAGIYGLVILGTLYPLSHTPLASIVSWLGVLTAFFATLRAIRSDEIKGLLAWSSVAQVGYIVASLSLGSSTGVAGGLYHAILHTIIKVLLFTTIAGVIQRTGKTRFDEMGGLIKKMPFSFIAVLFGIIALAGMPPLGGFNGKWLIYSAFIEQGMTLRLVIIIAASTAAFLYNYKLIYGIFLGHPTEINLDEMSEIGWGYRIAVIPALILLMAIGMFPGALFAVINPVLADMGIIPIAQNSMAVIATGLGSYNGLVVMATFMGAFAVILLLFTLIKGEMHNAHRFDIAYAAETPDENTPLHYGHGMGFELHRIGIFGFWLKKSTKPLYETLHHFMTQGASLVRLIYNGNVATVFHAAFIGALLLWLFISGGQA